MKVWPIIVVLAVVGYGVNKIESHPKPATSAGEAQMVVVANGSACDEIPSAARIYVDVIMRNQGNAAGPASPYLEFDYSDGGISGDSLATSVTIAAGATKHLRFYHTYNAQQHTLIRCSASASAGGTAKQLDTLVG